MRHVTPTTPLRVWVDKEIFGFTSDRVFVQLAEIGLLVGGVLFLIGL